MEDFKPLIKNTKFVRLWTSQLFSQMGISIMNFLLLIKIFQSTGSTIATSFLWVTYALPAIIVGPFAATSVDMIDRRKTLMTTNFFQGTIILVYAFTHQTSFFLLYGVVLAYSFLNQFYIPAEAASLPSLVSRRSLPQANGLFFLTQQVALIIGFSLAGIFNQLLGFANTLFFSSALLFFAFVSVSFLPKMKVKEYIPKRFEDALVNFFARIMEGYRFIRLNRPILLPFLILVGLYVILAVIMVSVPVLAKDIFKIGTNMASLFIVIPGGAGAALGTFTVSRLVRQGWRKKRIINTFLKILAFSFFLFTFVVPELSGSARFILGVGTTFLAGLSFIGIFIPTQTFLQEKTPGGLRGRVFGNFWFVATIVTIFPVVFSGAVTELFGIRILLFFFTAIILATLVASKRYGDGLISTRVSIKNG